MRTIKTILATGFASLALTSTSPAGSSVNVAGASGIALNGYDPVAFFTDRKPVHGDPGITGSHQGATYLFASEGHRKAFELNPGKYVPQFGGYCAYGAAVGIWLPCRMMPLQETKIATDLLEFSRDHELHFLVPMVTLPREMAEIRRRLRTFADAAGFETLPALGAMIETPTAAITISDHPSRRFLQHRNE